MRLPALALVLTACFDSRPEVQFPSHAPAIPTDGFYSQVIAEWHGGRKPGRVDVLGARCADAKVCTATVLPPGPDRAWAELRVIALAPGTTTVIAEYVDPRSQQRIERQLAIAVTSAAPLAAQVLSLGEPLPATDTTTHYLRASALAPLASHA